MTGQELADVNGPGDGRVEWEFHHRQPRFLPKYPCERVVRFLFTRLVRAGAEGTNCNILDLGCGGGRHTVLLAREGFDTVAMDYSRPGLDETGRRLAAEGLRASLVQGDMHTLPFQTGSFDGVIAYGSIYYTDLPGITRAVKEIHRVLKPQGTALVFTRTTRDSRFGAGVRLDSNSYRFVSNDTNEGGMKNCFLNEEDVHRLFGEFRSITLDEHHVTLNGRAIRNSDWVIEAVR